MQRRSSNPIALGTEPPPAWAGVAVTLVAVAAMTLLVYPLKTIAPVLSLGVVYLPAILVISIVWGLRMGLLASLVSAAAFNFFQIPPLHRFAISDQENWVALATFAIAAIISSTVAGLARARAVEAERRGDEAGAALLELEALARERDRMQAEAVEAEAFRRSDELKTALLRSISHDLRTPLTSMIAGGSALGSTSLTEAERAELSEAVVAEGNRLSRLVENLLDMSRLEAGKASPRLERVDVGELIDAARGGLPDPGLVRLAIDPELPLLDADGGQLERAFANLLENAVRHGGGRPVQVRSRLVGGRTVIRVVDQGPGIPELERRRIFEPFHRGPGGDGATGSGLGLAIAQGFVEANGGEIEVESMPGQGTTMVVSFPGEEQR